MARAMHEYPPYLLPHARGTTHACTARSVFQRPRHPQGSVRAHAASSAPAHCMNVPVATTRTTCCGSHPAQGPCPTAVLSTPRADGRGLRVQTVTASPPLRGTLAATTQGTASRSLGAQRAALAATRVAWRLGGPCRLPPGRASRSLAYDPLAVSLPPAWRRANAAHSTQPRPP